MKVWIFEKMDFQVNGKIKSKLNSKMYKNINNKIVDLSVVSL